MHIFQHIVQMEIIIFFIYVNFHFGYLGHPWQQKVWIYGKKLIEEFKKADLEGFKLIEEKN